jgi:hypothetical protein
MMQFDPYAMHGSCAIISIYMAGLLRFGAREAFAGQALGEV